ncbi:MAG: hypothetical protein F4Z08_01220 [Chloroflexi bacterium]|nr:hypothetical protein [Chloroflexota bacterium]
MVVAVARRVLVVMVAVARRVVVVVVVVVVVARRVLVVVVAVVRRVVVVVVVAVTRRVVVFAVGAVGRGSPVVRGVVVPGRARVVVRLGVLPDPEHGDHDGQHGDGANQPDRGRRRTKDEGDPGDADGAERHPRRHLPGALPVTVECQRERGADDAQHHQQQQSRAETRSLTVRSQHVGHGDSTRVIMATTTEASPP